MQEKTQPFNIKRYLALIQRRKYIVLSVCFFVLSLFTWGSFLIPKTYEASTTVSIERGSVLQPLMQGVGVSGNREDKLLNIKSEITGRNILEKAAKKISMDTHAGDFNQNALMASIKKNMDVKVRGEKPNLFSISYSGDDPAMVARVVNTVTNVYIDEYKQSKWTDASEAFEFIQSQVLEYKNKLEASDRETREFREKHPNIIPQTETTLTSRLEGFQDSKIEANIKIKELMRKRDNLQKQLSGEKELTVAIISREGSPQARLNTLNNQLMILMTKYTESYPEVVKVKAEIEELKKQISQAKDAQIEGGSETATLNPIYQQLKEELARTEAEIESLRGRSTELSFQQQEIQSRLGYMPKEQEEWTKIQRNRNVYQQTYDQLLQKLENARVSRELEGAKKDDIFRLIDSAVIPSLPVKPNRVNMILLGLFLGIVSGIGVILGLDYFDHSFKDEDAVAASLELPVLATIPKIITEADELSAKKLERKVFRAAGVYLLIIGLVLIEEIISRYMRINIINF